MASIQMNRGTKAEIDNTPITDGLISFETDDNYIYLDNGGVREPFGGVKVVPNPQDEPTEILRNLQIADDVYKISGGHEIENQSGTTLTQRDSMQFTGAYSHDDSINEVTKIDIVREMTASQKDSLSNGDSEGFQWTTDENDDLPLTADWIDYDDNSTLKDKIDTIETEIDGIVYVRYATIEPTTNETWASLLGRMRDANSTLGGKLQFARISLLVDNQAGMLFQCNRVYSSAMVTIWTALRPTSTGFFAYIINTSATSAVFRKYEFTTSGMTITDMSENSASSVVVWRLDV